ncbi:Rho-associated protein kinase 2 [Irineochytrium annulatum]|nr:Rho-associated protein kinase 2 [Irineochytrium annulatum]
MSLITPAAAPSGPMAIKVPPESGGFTNPFRSRFEQISMHISTIGIPNPAAQPSAMHHSASSSTLTLNGSLPALAKDKDDASMLSLQSQQHATLSFEGLLDSFLALVMDCKAASNQNEHVVGFLSKYDKLATRLQSLRVNTQDFEVVKTLATGAVGKVCLVIGRSDKQVYAMKVLKKTDLLTRREAAFFMEERNALVFGHQSQWITTLYAAFQDEENLYLVMEYASGGSLRALMNNRETPMSEEDARFYVAEMLLALDELHRLNFIHRDVKPENCLIVSSGHLKLADFGSCIRIGDANKVTSHETVGTPDYISPEILRAHEGKVNYSKEVDMWSLGIITYELLFDEVPFYAESLTGTYGKIMEHEVRDLLSLNLKCSQKTFAFPDDIEISADAASLIGSLVCRQDKRLGRNNANEIKNHAWFKDFPWDNVNGATPPFIPELSGPDDTRYFDDEENESKKVARKTLPRTKEFTGQNLPFIGYTYVHNATPTVMWPFQRAIPVSRSGGNLAAFASGAPASGAVNGEGSTEAEKRRRAEERIAVLEQQRIKDQQAHDELQSIITRLERDRSKLEGELRSVQTASSDHGRDKEELESRLTTLRRRLDSEAQASRARIDSLQEEHESLTQEIKTLQAEVEKAKERELGSGARDETRALEKAETEKTIAKLNARLLEATMQMNEALVKAEESTRTSSRDAQRRVELQQELQQLLQKNDDLVVDNQTLRKSLHLEAAKLEKAVISAMELEKSKTLIHVDLLSARRQIDELKSEKASIEKALSDRKESTGAALADATELRNQIASINAQRASDADALSRLSKEKAMLELELAQALASLQSKSEGDQGLAAKNAGLEAKIKTQSDRIAFLEECRDRANEQQSKTEKDLRETKSLLVVNSQRHQELEDKVNSLERDKSHLKSELQASSQKQAADVTARKDLQVKIADLERSLAEERRSRLHLDSDQQRVTASMDELKDEIGRLQSRMLAMRTEQSKLVDEHEKALAKVNDSLLSMSEKWKAEQRQKLELGVENLRLKEEVATRGYLGDDDPRILELEKLLEDAEAQNRELNAHRGIELSRSMSLQYRVEELEALAQLLRDQIDDNKAKQTRSLDSLRPDSKSLASEASDRTKSKMRLFFKGQQQKAEQEKAMQRIHEAEEDVKRDQRHARRISGGSSASFMSSFTKLSDPAINFEFDLLTGLRGHLKVPKGGKVKKGWKIRYAVVREFKLFMYDKESHMESQEGTMIADLRADLFVAKSVAQNELIHASAKDIDCVFKIQCTQGASLHDASASMNSVELSRRIVMLKTEIEREEKMQVATERMLTVSTDSQKYAVIAQLEVSVKRIGKLRSELDGLLTQLNQKSTSDKDSVEIQSLDELSAEVLEEETSQCKKNLESQLADELIKYNNLLKLTGGSATSSNAYLDKKSTKTNPQMQPNQKEIELEIQSIEGTMHRLKEDIAVLDSDDKVKVEQMVRRLCDRNPNGHSFRNRQYYKPMDCAYCFEALWGHRSLECAIERARWVAGLEFFRKEAEKVFGQPISPHYQGPPLPTAPVQAQAQPGSSKFISLMSLGRTNSLSMLTRNSSREELDKGGDVGKANNRKSLPYPKK